MSNAIRIIKHASSYAGAIDRNTLYLRLWLAWSAMLVVGGAYVLSSVGPFN